MRFMPAPSEMSMVQCLPVKIEQKAEETSEIRSTDRVECSRVSSRKLSLQEFTVGAPL